MNDEKYKQLQNINMNEKINVILRRKILFLSIWRRNVSEKTGIFHNQVILLCFYCIFLMKF